MLGLTLSLDKKSKKPLYIQLYDAIKEEIASGNLSTYGKLPSIRQLADYLKISRTTIEVTYHQLSVEGYIKSSPKVGYFVNKIEDNPFLSQDSARAIYSGQEGGREKEEDPYDFRNDHIDGNSFDFTTWRKYLNKALTSSQERFLTYGSFQGEYELRREIAKYVYESRGAVSFPDQVIIGSGVQSLLHILCGILKDKYQNIGFEDPGFKQARHIFRDHNFKIKAIDLEEDGINVASLEKSRAKIVYVSPSHQFPTGSVMSINKRIQLLNWARREQALIIEDDYDSELRYSGRPIPSLQGLDKGAHVIYLGSFSKILLPSIRISYMVLPHNLLEQYGEKMAQYNQTSSKIEQLALALYMREGLLEKHIRKLRKVYAGKNQVLVDTIRKIMGDKVQIRGEKTGLHIMLELKTCQSSQAIAALADKVGVKVTPLSNYYINNDTNKYPLVLLSYGGIPEKHMEPAITLLNQVWFSPLAT